MDIGKRDVIWNFGATILRVASGILILPLVLRILSPEDVGLWTVFLTIGSFTLLLDFGFGSAFTRNITYIFSGAKELKHEGYINVIPNSEINHGLLKSMILVMKKFYLLMAIFLLLLLLTVGSGYIFTLLKQYSGNQNVVLISWILYVFFVVFQLYTLYFDSLLQGRGYIRRSKQIIIISQIAEITTISLVLLAGGGIFSLVLGKAILVILNRILSYKAFYDTELKEKLRISDIIKSKPLFKIIAPNAIKIGLTSLGAFLITRSAIFIGSLYFSLEEIASYGISKQVIDLIGFTGSIWFSTYYPLLTKNRIEGQIVEIKNTYIKSKLLHILIFFIGGFVLISLGNFMLKVVGSQTFFLSKDILIFFLIVAFLESNHSMSAGLLLTKNEVPFFKAAIVSGICFVLLLLILLKFTSLGLLALIIAPGIVQGLYQNWKWPYEVWKDLNIKLKDFVLMTFQISNSIFKLLKIQKQHLY
jgi:O-antigen/teichoic acid export membrane protein